MNSGLRASEWRLSNLKNSINSYATNYNWLGSNNANSCEQIMRTGFEWGLWIAICSIVVAAAKFIDEYHIRNEIRSKIRD
ncbi:hypothetical protein DSCO28_55960 [Desulfosarcina ovata subsp. sediminis]|uniref:Uncharacterized protein n=1 Tax=Desulfosarcina ovata subsp. sediminis TaxID=885957 RepID=A0A5K7ZY60_9BACT|nr:hypothetical protein DSCO28_55960 [Desulfosarcina ovata subsp. sediminis]